MFSVKMIGIARVTKCLWTNTNKVSRLSADVLRFSTSCVNKGKPRLLLTSKLLFTYICLIFRSLLYRQA